MKNIIITLTAILVAGITIALISTFTVNDKIKGSEAVGIVVKDGNNIVDILSTFTIKKTDIDCKNTDLNATTTSDKLDCQDIEIKFQNKSVRVYIILPKTLENTALFEKLGNFPFAGQLYYENENEDSEKRLIKMMEEQGNNSYTIIYEQ